MKRFGRLLLCVLASASLVSCSSAVQTDVRSVHDYKTDALPPDVEVVKDIEYGKAGDASLRLNIIRPEQAEKPLPVIIFLHGGGWCSGNKDDSTGLMAGFAQLGYVCASVEYRFFDVAVFPAQIEDCKNAVRFLRANATVYGIDPDHIGAWGDSAGGHLAALLAASGDIAELEGQGGWQEHSSRVQAAVDWYGPVGLSEMNLSQDDIYSKLLGTTPQENRELARLSDPMSLISSDDPPILIMHGDRDNVVPIILSTQYAEKLRQGGVDVTMETVKGAGHGDGFWGEAAIYAKVLAFFDKVLKK